jgi:hypothetical protein
MCLVNCPHDYVSMCCLCSTFSRFFLLVFHSSRNTSVINQIVQTIYRAFEGVCSSPGNLGLLHPKILPRASQACFRFSLAWHGRIVGSRATNSHNSRYLDCFHSNCSTLDVSGLFTKDMRQLSPSLILFTVLRLLDCVELINILLYNKPLMDLLQQIHQLRLTLRLLHPGP